MRKREINGKTCKKSANRIPDISDSIYRLEKSEFSDSFHYAGETLVWPEIELELDEANMDWLQISELSESPIIPADRTK